MKIFHFWHKFDPDKWELLSKTMIEKHRYDLLGKEVGQPLPQGNQYLYRNTCVVCGDLVFRKVTEVE